MNEGNRKYMVVAAVVIGWSLIMILVGRAVFSGSGEKTETKTAETTQVNSAKQVSKKGNSEYNYGFTLSYPDGWVELDRDALRMKDPLVVGGFGKTNDKSNPQVIVKIERYQKADINDLLPTLKDKMKTQLKDFKEDDSGRTKLGKADAVQIVYSWTAVEETETPAANGGLAERRTPLKQRTIIGLRNGWAYYLICSSAESGFKDADADFGRIISTFNMN